MGTIRNRNKKLQLLFAPVVSDALVQCKYLHATAIRRRRPFIHISVVTETTFRFCSRAKAKDLVVNVTERISRDISLMLFEKTLLTLGPLLF